MAGGGAREPGLEGLVEAMNVSSHGSARDAESGYDLFGQDVPSPATIRAQQIGLLHRSVPAALIANGAISATLAAVVWPSAAHGGLLVWLSLIVILIIARAATWLAFPRAPLDALQAGWWSRLFVIYSGLSGGLWTLIEIVVLGQASLISQMFLGVVLAGTGAGAVAASSCFMPALYAFLLPAVLPYALLMALDRGPYHIAIAGLTLLFATCLVIIGRSFERSVVAGLKLQHQNDGLVRRLIAAHEALLGADKAKSEMIERLVVSRREAESANHAKSMFLAIMSHELRTPLNAIIGFSDLIVSQALGPLNNAKYLEYAGDIRDSGAHLLGLIDKVLDLSKIEAGRFELHDEDIDVASLIGSVVRLFRQTLIKADLTVRTAAAPGAERLRADERSAKQMLINLVSNAIKFAPAGSVVAIEAMPSPEGGMVLAVSDCGQGIAPEDIPKALAPFSQIANPLTRKHEGTGLGLSLVKALIELHGGRIEIASALGRGTTARLLFPAWRVGAPARPGPEPRLEPRLEPKLEPLPALAAAGQ
jgi:two-component system, cell cycle sensor histidine kinase PleC